MVNVVEALEVETPLSDLVLPEPPQQLEVAVLNAADEIQDEVCLASRESDERRQALMTAVVAIAVAPEADNARSPHHWWLARPLAE